MIILKLEENNPNPFKSSMEEEMEKALKHLDGELVKIRTGRAHTSLVEDIRVACYGGAPMPLKQIAAVSAPEARLLTVQPWDAGTIGSIEKALQTSDIGITPLNDGKIIRLQLPEMSHARREELVKILGKRLEECKVTLRNVRKEFNNLIRDGKKDKEISENFHSRLSDILEEVTTSFIKKAEERAQKKEKEITTI